VTFGDHTESLHPIEHTIFFTIVNDASWATWVYLMKSRIEASKHLKGFINMVKNQFDKSVKVIRSDNGSEFTSDTRILLWTWNST